MTASDNIYMILADNVMRARFEMMCKAALSSAYLRVETTDDIKDEYCRGIEL